MSAAPTAGTATFLFSDIEGSSALWERAPDAMRGALADHDEIVRDAVARHRGVVFKAMGDAFCCVFGSARDAAAAAVDAQRALHEHAWPDELGELRVRMGIHCGKAVERDGDYFGPTINRVARLMAIGSGGQILASSAAASLLPAAPAGAHLIDLGSHRLRDLSQPETVYQIAADGLPGDFPALASLDAQPNNLPSQFSSFVGRERETDVLRALLERQRLVTIAGPGGIGKTRLALQLAAGTIHRYADGAWFVDLSGISDSTFVAQAIASELGVREAPTETIAETLLAHLTRRRLLLLLDNSEQVLVGVAAIVKTILSRCAGVTVLVTSREPLHLAGEQVHRLTGLPETPAGTGAADLLRHDATRLFLERARAVAPGLTVTDETAGDVLEICRKLDGIPLAIELAAARVSALSVRELDEHLGEKLSVLTSRDTTLERHRTLRATIEWSYRLLAEPEKAAFARLSVFAGGFTLAAYERVAAVAGEPPLDQLESLVEKSFVQRTLEAPASRYRCLDVMREYGASELAKTGSAQRAERAHADYYAEFAAGGRGVRGAAAAAWYRVLDDDIANLRAALDSYARNDSPKAARLALDLCAYWRVRSTIAEARARLDALVDEPEIASGDRAELLTAAASFATMQDDFDRSLRCARAALAIYRTACDASGTGEALFRIAEVEHRRGRLEEATRLYDESLELFIASGHARGEMLCLANLGMIARQRGAYEEAKRLLEDALARAAAASEHRIAGEFSIAIGWVNLYLGDGRRAKELFEAAFARKRDDGDRYGACAARHGLATVALKDGRLDDAFEAFRETIGDALDLRLQDYVFRGFDGVAAVLALRGDMPRAARYLGLAQRIFRESGRELRDSIAYDIAAPAIGAGLEARRRAELLAEGESHAAEEAARELSVEG